MVFDRYRHLAPLLMMALCALFGHRAIAADPDGARVAILVGPLKSYRLAASAMETSLTSQGHTCIRIQVPRDDDPKATAEAVAALKRANATVVATTGIQSTSLALRTVSDIPIVFCLVPNALDAPFMAPNSPDRMRVAGVSGDIDPAARMEWMLRIDPDCHNLGLPFSPGSERTMEAVKKAAEARGIAVTPVATTRDEFSSSVHALKKADCDAVLMLPDPRIYNAKNVQHMLLWGIRYKKTVWGFSPNLVKAGAMAAQYFDPEAVGQQTAALIVRAVAGESLSEIGVHDPELIRKAVNEHTARLVGVSVPDEATAPSVVRYGVEP